MAAEGHIQIEVESSHDPIAPLLKNTEQAQEPNPTADQDNDKETLLDKTLQRLDLYLSFMGFNQSSMRKFVMSWGVFLVIGIFLPVAVLELSNCPGCEKGQIKSFEIGMVVSQACLAAASLLCLSHNLRKYGVRKFLFVDRYSGHVERFSDQYVQKISVTSIVELVSIILCLNAAAKISHRAQGIGAIACKWHALITSSASDGPSILRSSCNSSEINASFHMDYSESDLESVDFMTAPTNTQLALYMESYHKRLALVMYLQANPGGITIFGWTVDRGLINTIFFIELSLVTCVLGMTTVGAPGL